MSDFHNIKVEISELPHFRFKVPYRCNLKVRRDFMIFVFDKKNDIDYQSCIDLNDLMSRFDVDCQYCLDYPEDISESCQAFVDRYLLKKESPDDKYKIRGVKAYLNGDSELELVRTECKSKIDKIQKVGCKACPYCLDGECLRSVDTLKIIDKNIVHGSCPLHLAGGIQ